MILHDDIPETSFHAIWSYNGNVWGSTFKFENDCWYLYDSHNNDWEQINHPSQRIPSNSRSDIGEVLYYTEH